MTNEAKLKILAVARQLFGDKGFDSTSIRDISSKAKVNVAMIAYYFGCKEHLYLACMSQFATARVEQLKKTLIPATNLQDFKQHLEEMILLMVSTYEEDAPILKMLMREMQNDRKKVSNKLIEITNPFFFTIRDYFQAAIDAKIISSKYDANNIAIVFMGALKHPIDCETAMQKTLKVSINDPEFRNQYYKTMLEIFLNGVTS